MRLLLAEDHNLVRIGIRMLVESIANLTVVGEAADGLEALRLIGELKPDCVLMELAMPGLSGLEAIQRATSQFQGTRILVVSLHADDGDIHQPPAAGAALAMDVQLTAPCSPLNALTPRQREVLRLVAEGHSTKQVAAHLGLSAKTVEAHRGAIMRRLDIHDLAGLVRLAVRAGLVAGDH